MNYKPEKEWLYLVHQGEWPAPMQNRPLMYLVPPAQLVGSDTNWMALPLDRQEEGQKEQSIREYKSQTTILGKLLFSFIRMNELFGEYPSVELYKNSDKTNLFSFNTTSRVISAPTHYYFRLQLDRSAAVNAIYATLSEDEKLNLSIRMSSAIKADITYQLNLILFGNTQASDVKLIIRDGKVTENTISGQPFTNADEIQLSQDSNYLHITFPIKSFYPIEHMFINVATSQGSFKLDRTAWRMVDIED
jgi:hypothetical protein